MKKLGIKTLSVILTLALLAGMAPAMQLVAQAAPTTPDPDGFLSVATIRGVPKEVEAGYTICRTPYSPHTPPTRTSYGR